MHIVIIDKVGAKTVTLPSYERCLVVKDKSVTRGCFTSRAYDSIRRECRAMGVSDIDAKVYAREAYAAAANAYDKA